MTRLSSDDVANKLQLVFTDMDGTLCRADSSHHTTIRAINQLKEIGVPVIPVTARTRSLASSLLKKVGIPEYPAGYHHGALTYDRDGDILVSETVPKQAIECVIEASKRMFIERSIHSAVIVHLRDDRIVAHDDSEFSITSKRADITRVTQDGAIVTTGGASDMLKLRVAVECDMPSEALESIYQSPSALVYQVNVIRREFEKAGIQKLLKTFPSGRYWIDSVSTSGGKLNSLRALTVEYGCTLANSLALGDNHNDMDMVAHSGVGIAMGNAPKELKECAKHVTSDVTLGGWDKAIQKYFGDRFKKSVNGHNINGGRGVCG